MADAKPSRQRPGQACLSCRAKKLKCDGLQPSCSNCSINGAACVVPTTSAKRGPPKGHMLAMQSRLANLEQKLLAMNTPNSGAACSPTVDPADVNNTPVAPTSTMKAALLSSTTTPTTATVAPQVPAMFAPTATSMNSPENHNSLSPALLHSVMDQYPFPDKAMMDIDMSQSANDQPFQMPSPSASQHMLGSLGDMFNFSNGPSLNTTPDNILGDDLLRADLSVQPRRSSLLQKSPVADSSTHSEQLYFDRVHAIAPVVHRRRYFSWASSSSKTPAQLCLQHAMCMLAAALTSQYGLTRQALYDRTVTLLNAFESSESADVSVEHLQARLLVLLYDFMRSTHDRGWISAGKCFRLIQLARLHETDAGNNMPGDGSRSNRSTNASRSGSIISDDSGMFCGGEDLDSAGDSDWIILEEKRRVFWIAFCIDIFVSISQQWPLTLHEHTAGTRLPMPEQNFQRGSYVRMDHFKEDLDLSPDVASLSPLHESIKCAALYRKLILHRQRYVQSDPQDISFQAFWRQHEQIDAVVRSRAQSQQEVRAQLEMNPDPMVIITHMVLNLMALGLMEVIENTSWQTPELGEAVMSYRQRAMSAAIDIFDLSKLLSGLSYLKVSQALSPTPFSLNSTNAKLQRPTPSPQSSSSPASTSSPATNIST